jgi:hypothetical protein
MSRLFVLIISLLISLPFSAQNTSLGATQNLAQSETSVKTWNLYGLFAAIFLHKTAIRAPPFWICSRFIQCQNT